jgi:hypothetical protein
MNALTAAFLTAGTLTVTIVIAFILVIAGIHSDEHRMSLSAKPRTLAEIIARRVMDVHVSQSDACRFLTAQQPVLPPSHGKIL